MRRSLDGSAILALAAAGDQHSCGLSSVSQSVGPPWCSSRSTPRSKLLPLVSARKAMVESRNSLMKVMEPDTSWDAAHHPIGPVAKLVTSWSQLSRDGHTLSTSLSRRETARCFAMAGRPTPPPTDCYSSVMFYCSTLPWLGGRARPLRMARHTRTRPPPLILSSHHFNSPPHWICCRLCTRVREHLASPCGCSSASHIHAANPSTVSFQPRQGWGSTARISQQSTWTKVTDTSPTACTHTLCFPN